MSKTVAGITEEKFNQESLWVCKFTNRPRIVDTYPNLEKILGEDFFSRDDVRDVDLLCYEGQPDSVKPFMLKMREIDRDYGWMTIPEIFKKFGVDDSVEATA